MSAEQMVDAAAANGLAHSLEGHIQLMGDISGMVAEIEGGLFGAAEEPGLGGVAPPIQDGLSHSVVALANELHKLRDRLQNLHGKVVGGGTC